MSFRWRYERTDGTQVDGPALTFTDQAEAEAWFTAEFEGLADDGVEQVVLIEDEREVYGPMLLSA